MLTIRENRFSSVARIKTHRPLLAVPVDTLRPHVFCNVVSVALDGIICVPFFSNLCYFRRFVFLALVRNIPQPKLLRTIFNKAHEAI